MGGLDMSFIPIIGNSPSNYERNFSVLWMLVTICVVTGGVFFFVSSFSNENAGYLLSIGFMSYSFRELWIGCIVTGYAKEYNEHMMAAGQGRGLSTDGKPTDADDSADSTQSSTDGRGQYL